MRTIGMKPDQQNPVSYIILMRLRELQSCYGGSRLLAAVLAVQANMIRNFNPRQSPSVHLSNLIETYGRDMVLNIYNQTYNLKNTKKVG